MLARLLLGASLLMVLGAAAADEKPFTPKEGGFSILFPGVPKENKQETKTPAGTVAVTYYVVEKGGVTYVASFSVFPKESVKPRTEEKRLDNARDGAVASAKGKLEGERKIKMGKYPAREVLIRGEKSFVRSRIYAVENRLYQTMVIGTRDQAKGKEATEFLKSFRLK
jgi:hypothetical protein